MVSAADVVRIVRKVVAPIERRTRLTVSRAVVALVDDARKMQEVQVGLLIDETRDAEHFQPFGLTGVPPKDSEGVFLAVGGNRDHGIVVCVSDRSKRPTGLQPGEAGLYNVEGLKVLCELGGKVYVGVKEDAELVAHAAKVDARCAAIESKLNSLIGKFNNHTHASAGATIVPAQQETSLDDGASTAAAKTLVQ